MICTNIRAYTNAESTFSDIFCRRPWLLSMLACDLTQYVRRKFSFRLVLREGTSWRQFLGANFEPFEIYNFFMWVRESFCSCLKLQKLECWLLRASCSDLNLGKEWSTHLHGKAVSKCFVIVIYTKEKSWKNSTM